jgi:hypothetical protein
MANEAIEVTVARLDERFRGFQDAFGQMVEDQRRLTDSYEKLVESNQRIGLVELDLVNLKSSNHELWLKFDAMAAAHAKVTGHVLYDVLKLTFAVLGGMVMSKLGFHLP